MSTRSTQYICQQEDVRSINKIRSIICQDKMYVSSIIYQQDVRSIICQQDVRSIICQQDLRSMIYVNKKMYAV